MNLKGKMILVTGGRGFIGQNLVNKLSKFNATVDIFDIEDGQDITKENLIIDTIKKRYDFIYHLAAFSGSQKSLKNNNQCFKINTLATVSILDAIIKFSPKTKIIISSSRLEYGHPEYLPVDEKHPTEPTTPYGLSKLIATQIAQVLSKTSCLLFTVFRTSNVYGPHSNSKFLGYNLVNHFIDIANKSGTLKIFGNGEQLRDYLYIDDLTEAFLLATEPDSDNKIYNLGYGRGISLMEMTLLITKIVGKGKIIRTQWPKDWKSVETGSYETDISKINRDLGFSPIVSFEDGIKKTIKST